MMLSPPVIRRLMSRLHCSIICLLLIGVVSCDAPERYTRIVDVEPVVDTKLIGQSGEPNFEVMLVSYKNYGPVHAMTYYGDFDEFVDGHHKQLMN